MLQRGSLAVISSPPQIVVYDYSTFTRYDLVEPWRGHNEALKWPDWPEYIIEFIKEFIPKYVYEAQENIWGTEESAANWADQAPFKKIVEHPANKGEYAAIANVIISLNDFHKWTREKIADWLETLDEQPTFELNFEVDSQELQTETFRLPKFASLAKLQLAG